jgi:N-acetylneuraminate synthase
MPEINIGGRLVGDGHPPLIIAECGINDGGRGVRVEQLIVAAVDAGCGAVKWQWHHPEESATPAPWQNWTTVPHASSNAQHSIVPFGCTVFCAKALEDLLAIDCRFLKIGSGEVSNHQLVEAVAQEAARRRIPVLLSTGMHDLTNVDLAVNILRAYDVKLGVLECTSSYPARPREVRLRAIPELRKRYPDAVIGLSDHTPDIYTALGAIGIGASIVEKHFTVDRDWLGPDNRFSIEPREMHLLVEGAAQIHEAMTAPVHTVSDDERETAKWAQHAIVAARDIKEGEKLQGAIACRRPQGPVHARRWREVQRMRAACDIKAGAQLSESDLDDWSDRE